MKTYKWLTEMKKCSKSEDVVHIYNGIFLSHQGNSNQNHTEIPPYNSQNGKNGQGRKQQMLEKKWRKGIPPTLLVGMQVGITTLETSAVVP